MFEERKHTNDRQGLKTIYLLLLIKLAAYDDSNITKIDETICFLTLPKKEIDEEISVYNQTLILCFVIFIFYIEQESMPTRVPLFYAKRPIQDPMIS